MTAKELGEQTRRLFEEHLALCDRAVNAFDAQFPGLVDRGELTSSAQSGLLDAARRFDAERGVPFEAFAYYRVRGAIIDGVRKMGHLPRRLHRRFRLNDAILEYASATAEDAFAPVPPDVDLAAQERRMQEHYAGMATAAALGITVADSGADTPSSVVPEEAVVKSQLLDLVERELAALTDAEATLIRRHYLQDEAIDVISHDLGYSKSWGSRLHARALNKLTKRLRGRV